MKYYYNYYYYYYNLSSYFGQLKVYVTDVHHLHEFVNQITHVQLILIKQVYLNSCINYTVSLHFTINNIALLSSCLRRTTLLTSEQMIDPVNCQELEREIKLLGY